MRVRRPDRQPAIRWPVHSIEVHGRVDRCNDSELRGRGGGDEETRTPDPLLAKEMLYQLSYVPRAR